MVGGVPGRRVNVDIRRATSGFVAAEQGRLTAAPRTRCRRSGLPGRLAGLRAAAKHRAPVNTCCEAEEPKPRAAFLLAPPSATFKSRRPAVPRPKAVPPRVVVYCVVVLPKPRATLKLLPPFGDHPAASQRRATDRRGVLPGKAERPRRSGRRQSSGKSKPSGGVARSYGVARLGRFVRDGKIASTRHLHDGGLVQVPKRTMSNFIGRPTRTEFLRSPIVSGDPQVSCG
jgi:hypothetical protein